MKILEKTYKIIDVEDNQFSNSSMGRSNTRTGEILISSKMPPDIREETILHEVIHILSDTLGIDLSENQVLALSSGLYATFQMKARYDE